MGNYVLGDQAAQWLRNAMASRNPLRTSRTRAHSNRGSDRSRIPRAFEVHFAASVATSGAWVIYLPAGCLRIDNATVDPAASLSAAGGDYPAGWYQLGLAPAGALWLNLAKSAGGAWTASFGAAAANDLSVQIASVANYNVTQLVVGALALSSGSGGGGGESCTCPRKWYNRITLNAAETQATIANVLILAGDASPTCADTTVTLNTGANTCIYGHVEMTADPYDGSVSRSVSIVAGSEGRTTAGSDFYIPLWLVTADTPRKIYDATIPGIAKRT